MALTDESMGTTMLVQPAGNAGNNMFGGEGGWWILVLFLLLGNGGWGGGFGMGGDLYPWLNNSQNVAGGFRDQMINTGINGIQNAITSGFGDVQTALCGGFAGVNASITGAQNAITQQMYSNEINSLERSFAAQTANTAGMTALQGQLAQCCCDNRMATAQTQTVVQSEGAATRLAIQAQTQAILDKMCQQEIETLRAQNVSLQNQLNMANLAASQTAQTAALVADNTQQTQYIVNRVAPYPIPAYTVANPVTPAA